MPKEPTYPGIVCVGSVGESQDVAGEIPFEFLGLASLLTPERPVVLAVEPVLIKSQSPIETGNQGCDSLFH